MTPGPDAVLFDLDGTLVDTERESGEAIVRVFRRRYGVDPGGAALDGVIGAAWDDALRELHTALGLVEPDPTGLKAELLAAKAEILAGSMQMLPGAPESLQNLASTWPTAIVSGSWRDEVLMCVDRLGASSLVRVVIGSEDVRAGKPDPEGYLAAAHALGAVPDRCLVFEDSARGMRAARAAGCRIVGVRAGSLTPEAMALADIVIDDLVGVDAARARALWTLARPEERDSLSLPARPGRP